MGRWDEFRKTLSSAAVDNPWSRKESKVSCKETLGSENGGDGRGGIEKWGEVENGMGGSREEGGE